MAQTVYEANELGPLAVHGGTLYAMQADASIPRPGGFFPPPVARWHLVAIELASGEARTLTEAPVVRPDRVVADATGLAFVGQVELRLLDHGARTTHVVDRGCDPSRGIGVTPDEVVCVENRVERLGAICRLDRRTGRVTTRDMVDEVSRVAGSAQLLAWSLGAIPHTIHVEHAGAHREVDLHTFVQHMWAVGDAVIAAGSNGVVVVRPDMIAKIPDSFPSLHVSGGAAGWFTRVSLATQIGPEEHVRLASSIVRVGKELELVYSAELTGEDHERDLDHLARDEHHVYFVERLGETARILALPVDAPVIARETRTVAVKRRR